MNSILLQKYRPLRVSFVDDCSEDDTVINFAKYAQELANSDIQVDYSRNVKRMFYGNCLKIAHDMSKEGFFGCLDADDALMPDAISTVMEKYISNPQIGHIYTQFMSCDQNLNPIRKGFSSCPPVGGSMLSEGRENKHCYSHFRTFSSRVPRLEKVWAKDMRCAVDKYMGYRLEELSEGIYIDKPCYLWRGGRKGSISLTEPSRSQWNKVMLDARKRRSIWKIKPFPITKCKYQ